MTPLQGRTRRWFLLMGILGLAACRDAVAPRALTPPDPAAVIVDGAHNSGNDDVFFLPPLVDNPSSASGFGDPEQLGLPVNIKIKCLSHPSTSTCPDFDFPPNAVKSSSDAHYMINWDTKAPGVDPGDVYRVEIHVGDKTLAWADVFLVPNGNPKNVATQGDIPLPDGRTLPIKVRIEKGWDCTNRSNKSQCATQVVPNVAVDGSGSTIVQFAGTEAEPAGAGRFYDGWIPYSANCQPGSTTCVPTGTPVVVTIEDQTSILNASGATCSLKDPSGKPVTKMLTQLGTGEAQHPGRCVKFTTNPKFEFAKRVDVAVCVESPTPTQQLIKYDTAETPRFLQNVFFPIACEPSVGSTTPRSANPAIKYALNTLSRAGRALSELLTPKSAYAIHLGVGGLIPPGGNGGGFSYVAPAEPYTESVVGEYQQTAPVNTSVLGPQSRITTVHPSLSPAVGQNVRCKITGGGGSLGSLGGPTQVVVQTQAVRNDAGAIIDAVATCPAWYLGPTPGTNTLQMIALSIDDGITAMESDGEGGTQPVTLSGVETFTATATAPLGTIQGIVRDAAGAVLAGVNVTATNESEQTFPPRAPALTDDAGRFTIGALPAGTYTVTATASGQTVSQSDVAVDGATVTKDLNFVPQFDLSWGVLTTNIASQTPNRSIVVQFGYRNTGQLETAPFSILFYLADSPTASPTAPGSQAIAGYGAAALAAGGNNLTSINLGIPSVEVYGRKYIVAALDVGHTVTESNENNNIVGTPLDVIDGDPDLAITTAVRVNPNQVCAGDAVSIGQLSIQNQGFGTSGPWAFRFVLAGPEVSLNVFELGTQPSINVGTTASFNPSPVTIPVGTVAGEYNFGPAVFLAEGSTKKDVNPANNSLTDKLLVYGAGTATIAGPPQLGLSSLTTGERRQLSVIDCARLVQRGWSSSNPDVLSVSADGLVSANAPGEATVFLNGVDGAGNPVQARVILTVLPGIGH